MPRFKVTLNKTASKTIQKNPFVPLHIHPGDTTEILLRTWEMDAKDEAEIRQFFKEAKEKDFPNVRGFSLHSIEKLGPASITTSAPRKK